MRRRLALVLAVALMISLLPGAGTASNVGTSATGIRVLRLPGADLGTAVAINDAGWVALNTAVWKGIGYPTDLWPQLTAVDPGAGYLAVVDMDAAGEVVGTYRNVSLRSFLWSDTGGLQDIGVRTVTGIDGDIVGYVGSFSFVGRPGGFTTIDTQNFLAQGIDGGLLVGNGGTWTPTNGYVPLSGNGVAYDANASGTIVGHLAPGGGIVEAAYWSSQTADPVGLGTLPGDTMSQARAINDDGWIVGWSGTSTNPNVARRAFLWRSAAEGMIDLGFYPGDTTADAFAINNAGVIVGKSGFGPAVWDVNGTFTIDYPPEVAPFGPLSVDAGALLSEPITITDEEGDPYTATWSGLPAGTTWNGTTLEWQTATTDQGSYPISLTVTQDSKPLNTITIDTTIEVGPPAPTLDPIGDQTVAAGTLLTFTATATPGTPGNALTFSLSTATATGAAIDPSTGVFTWTPDATQAGPHSVTIEVSEDQCGGSFCATPPTTDSDTITVTVTAGDQSPVLTAIVATIGEFETLSIPRSDFLSDPDTPIDDITLTLEDGIDPVPPGAVINGIFEWTPGETDGGRTFAFTMRAADTSNPPNETTAPITITVVETNQPPVLAPIADQQVFTGDTVTFDADATDPDLPAQSLTYALEGAPAGATIDPATGVFSWPSATTGRHTFDVVVRDDWTASDGTPASSEDRDTVTILVVDPLQLPNDVSVDLSVLAGDPDGDGVVDRGARVTLRAVISETNQGAGDVVVSFSIPGAASLVSSTNDACSEFTINGNTALSCPVGSVFGSRNLDVALTLDDTGTYDIVAEVTSSANPETDVTNNTSSVALESLIRLSISELVGVSDALDVVPPLDLATILEAIAVGDGLDVVPPLTLDTILEAIGVGDGLDVVPPLDLATILENISVTDTSDVVDDSDGNGIPDITASAVDPLTGALVAEVFPGDEVLIVGSGMAPNAPASVDLHSDPVHLADLVTDANGTFAVVVTIPADTPPGDHRIVVTGEWRLGGPLEVIYPLEVVGICTISGTPGRDILFGTRGDDVICGFGGNDIIFSGRGDDIVMGGPGNDIILGGRGRDQLYGEAGHDIILGGRGDDTLVGGPGADLLIGGRGDDTVIQ